jgi:hypothetical protein
MPDSTRAFIRVGLQHVYAVAAREPKLAKDAPSAGLMILINR